MENNALIADASEPCLIGALLHDYRLIHQCRTKITEESFGNILCAATYRTMITLNRGGSGKFDLQSIFAALKSAPEFKSLTDSDTIQFLSESMISANPSIIDLYIQNVNGYHTRRKLALTADIAGAAARNMLITAEEAVKRAESAILSINGGGDLYRPNPEAYINKRLGYLRDPRSVRGFYSGFPILDSLTTGFGGENKTFAVIYGHSHVGKSLFVQQILEAMADPKYNNLGGKRLLVAPTELPPELWLDRIVAFKLGISTRTIQTGKFREIYKYKDKSQEYAEAIYQEELERVCALPIDWLWYEDRMVNGQDVLSYAITGRYAAIWVDGIKDLGLDPNLKKAASDNMIYAQIYANCQFLHQAALNSNVPIFATHQMKSMQATRKDKRPTPQDMFGGMDIFQRATFVGALYRESQHRQTGEANDRRMSAAERRKASLMIQKDLHGGSEGKIVDLEFRGDGGMGFKETGIRNSDD